MNPEYTTPTPTEPAAMREPIGITPSAHLPDDSGANDDIPEEPTSPAMLTGPAPGSPRRGRRLRAPAAPAAPSRSQLNGQQRLLALDTWFCTFTASISGFVPNLKYTVMVATPSFVAVDVM